MAVVVAVVLQTMTMIRVLLVSLETVVEAVEVTRLRMAHLGHPLDHHRLGHHRQGHHHRSLVAMILGGTG